MGRSSYNSPLPGWVNPPTPSLYQSESILLQLPITRVGHSSYNSPLPGWVGPPTTPHYSETYLIRHLYSPTFSLIQPLNEVQSPYIRKYGKRHSIIQHYSQVPLSVELERFHCTRVSHPSYNSPLPEWVIPPTPPHYQGGSVLLQLPITRVGHPSYNSPLPEWVDPHTTPHYQGGSSLLQLPITRVGRSSYNSPLPGWVIPPTTPHYQSGSILIQLPITRVGRSSYMIPLLLQLQVVFIIILYVLYTILEGK